MDRDKEYHLNQQARMDIKWWYDFIPQFDGTAVMWLIDVEEMDSEMAVDACMRGTGGISPKNYFHAPFPNCFAEQGLKITHLELWSVIVAVKVWSEQFKGKYIKIKTDNEAVATIINTGRSYDLYLQKQLRELCWCMVKAQCRIKAIHLAGKLNRVPDLLSRWGEGLQPRKDFWERNKIMKLKETVIPEKVFQFSNRW